MPPKKKHAVTSTKKKKASTAVSASSSSSSTQKKQPDKAAAAAKKVPVASTKKKATTQSVVKKKVRTPTLSEDDEAHFSDDDDHNAYWGYKQDDNDGDGDDGEGDTKKVAPEEDWQIDARTIAPIVTRTAPNIILSLLMPSVIISKIFSMLSLHVHKRLLVTSKLLHHIGSLPSSSVQVLSLYSNWLSSTSIKAFGRTLGRHVATQHIWIKQRNDRNNDWYGALRDGFTTLGNNGGAQLKSLQLILESKMTDINMVAPLTSLQSLSLEWPVDLPSSFDKPAERKKKALVPQLSLAPFVSLTYLNVHALSLISLSQLPHPLLLTSLVIEQIVDWDGNAEYALNDDDDDDDDKAQVGDPDDSKMSSGEKPATSAAWSALFGCRALRVFQLGHSGEQYHLSHRRLAQIVANFPSLQRLGIDSVMEPPPPSLPPKVGKKSKNGALIVAPQLPAIGWRDSKSITDVRYFEPDGDLRCLLSFPCITALTLHNPQSHWDQFTDIVAPKLVDLTLDSIGFSYQGSMAAIAACTNLTSLRIDGGNMSNKYDVNEWKHLPLKRLAFLVYLDGRQSKSAASSLLASIANNWSATLTDLTLSILGPGYDKRNGKLVDNIASICRLTSLVTLTFTNDADQTDEELLTLANEASLPVTLKQVRWQWRAFDHRRQGVHLRVRAAFATRGVMCSDIGIFWKATTWA